MLGKVNASKDFESSSKSDSTLGSEEEDDASDNMELEVNSGRAILEVAASSLTYHEIKSTDELENGKYHFVGIDIDLINNHAPKNDIIAKLQLGLSERGNEVQRIPVCMS